MTKSCIEITDQSFLIRLNKEEFDYSQIKTIVSQLFQIKPSVPYPSIEDIEAIDSEWNTRFDHLSDK